MLLVSSDASITKTLKFGKPKEADASMVTPRMINKDNKYLASCAVFYQFIVFVAIVARCVRLESCSLGKRMWSLRAAPETRMVAQTT